MINEEIEPKKEDWEIRADKARADLLLKGEDREKKIAFLKRWGKRIPPELLGPQTMHRGAPTSQQDPMPPLAQKLVQRRVLAMSGSGGKATYTFIDDDGSCDRKLENGMAAQNHVSADWHIYHSYSKWAEAQPEKWAIRCPRSITPAEWNRVMLESEFSSWSNTQESKAKPVNKPDFSVDEA